MHAAGCFSLGSTEFQVLTQPGCDAGRSRQLCMPVFFRRRMTVAPVVPGRGIAAAAAVVRVLGVPLWQQCVHGSWLKADGLVWR